MTTSYPIPAEAEILKALEAGPSAGPWSLDIGEGFWARDAYVRAPMFGVVARLGIDASMPHWDTPQRANAALIAACHPENLRAILAELQRLRQECDGLRRDADRYRWLRDAPWPPEVEVDILLHRNARWDATIDAEMEKDRP